MAETPDTPNDDNATGAGEPAPKGAQRARRRPPATGAKAAGDAPAKGGARAGKGAGKQAADEAAAAADVGAEASGGKPADKEAARPARRRATTSGTKGGASERTTGSGRARGSRGGSRSGTQRSAGTSRQQAAPRRAPKGAAAPRTDEQPSAIESAAARAGEAGKGLGEQVFRRVEEMIENGRTAKAAFEVVAKERKMSVSNVQQHYYRFRRKAKQTARDTARSADRRARSSAGKVVPEREMEAIRADLREISTDVRVLSSDVARAVGEVLQEASRSDAARRLRSNLRSMIPRR